MQRATGESKFRYGDTVRIDGIKDKPQYNGTIGTICGSYIESKGRYPIRMHCGAVFNLKLENIERVERFKSILLKPGNFTNENELLALLEPLDNYETLSTEEQCEAFGWKSGYKGGASVTSFSSDEFFYYIVWDDCFLTTQTEVNMIASYLYGRYVKGNCIIKRNWKMGDSPPEEVRISFQEIADLAIARKRQGLLGSGMFEEMEEQKKNEFMQQLEEMGINVKYISV